MSAHGEGPESRTKKTPTRITEPSRQDNNMSSDKTQHVAANNGRSCPLLDKIPAEIRNNIYELVFAVRIGESTDWEKAKDLTKARPPCKSLITTCRQIYQEARGIYRRSYRLYWTETHFSIRPSKRLGVRCGWKFDESNWETYGSDWLDEIRQKHGSSEEQLRRSEAKIHKRVRAEDLAHVTKLGVYDDIGEFYTLVDQCSIWFRETGGLEDWVEQVGYGGSFMEINTYLSKAEAQVACTGDAVAPLSMQIAALLTR